MSAEGDVIAYAVSDGEGSLIIKKCPYGDCQKTHIHGGDTGGYRVAHCTSREIRSYFLVVVPGE